MFYKGESAVCMEESDETTLGKSSNLNNPIGIKLTRLPVFLLLVLARYK